MGGSPLAKFFKACFGFIFLLSLVVVGTVFLFSFGRLMWHWSTLLIGGIVQ